MLSALHTIKSYPFDLAAPVFAHYPAMKLGHRRSVDHYAGLLAPVALKAIAGAPRDDRGWVLTSPPLQGLPSGANLVCRALYDRLAGALQDGTALRLDRLEVGVPRAPFSNEADFESFNNYSKLDLKTRQDFHRPRRQRRAYDLAGFAGRRAMFVNDINVTGMQLASITRLLHGAGVESLDVVLIVNVEPEVGRVYPRLEYEINTSGIATLPEFIALLRECEFEATGKLISRLMAQDAGQLAAVFEALPPAKRQQLHRAILQEGVYGSALFQERMQVVERALDERAIG